MYLIHSPSLTFIIEYFMEVYERDLEKNGITNLLILFNI